MSVLVGEQERLMAWLTLLFIVILTTVSEVTALHCSDQQLPASSDDDLQQVTTLQYCLVDGCTIKRIDTGEKLGIVYTTDSLIVTTPTDGCTSMVIAKQDSELLCVKPNDVFPDQLPIVYFVLVMASLVIVTVVSVFIVIMHVIFKELCTAVGKLLMLYNISLICHTVIMIPLLIAEYQVALNSLAFCYGCTVVILLSAVSKETYGTCLLHQTAYVMYYSDKLRSLGPEDFKRQFRYYSLFHLGTIMLVFIVIVCYDFTTGNYKDAIFPNGRCYFVEHESFATQFAIIVTGFNKTAQVVFFVAYLYYAYRVNSDISNPEILNNQQSLP